jgi:hypothetical protein
MKYYLISNSKKFNSILRLLFISNIKYRIRFSTIGHIHIFLKDDNEKEMSRFDRIREYIEQTGYVYSEEGIKRIVSDFEDWIKKEGIENMFKSSFT